MNEIFHDSVTIDAQLEDVWRFYSNLEENASKWMKGIPDLKKKTQGDIKEGTQFVFRARGKEQSSTLSEYIPMSKATLTSVQGKFRADYTYSFAKESETSTKVTLLASCEAGGASKLFSPLIKTAIKKADGNQLQNFKEAFEKKR